MTRDFLETIELHFIIMSKKDIEIFSGVPMER